jgi:voltage-gated potassium channel Kch
VWWRLTLVHGTVNDGLRRRRMNKRIERMEGHVIVAGWGRVGHSIAQYALRHGAEVAIVDQLFALGSHDEVRDLRMAVARRRTQLFRRNEVRA